jgi:hypothetical protein
MAKKIEEGDEQFTVTDAKLVQDGDSETTYTLRRLTRAQHREIQKQNTEKVINKRTHQREDQVDWAGVTDDLVDFVLVGWDGVVIRGGPAPCDRHHKLLLDNPTTEAILERAGLNEVTGASADDRETRDASFRQPPAVPGVLGR